MAEDAKVSQVSELTAFASKMQSFLENVSSNSTTLNNLMVQKLDSLRKKLKRAEQIEAEAIAEYNECFNTLAYLSNSDYEGRNALKAKLSKLEIKRDKAKMLRSEVASLVLTAQATTSCIIEATKKFQNKTKDNVDKGQKVIKKSVGQLEQYNENKKRI